jgi:hypothetical protein
MRHLFRVFCDAFSGVVTETGLANGPLGYPQNPGYHGCAFARNFGRLSQMNDGG